jgi:tetratricopeptide (TPR) repeat protein
VEEVAMAGGPGKPAQKPVEAPEEPVEERLAAAIGLRERGDHEAARQALLRLAAGAPGDARVAYHTAWAHDVLGLEAEAVPWYERALALGVRDDREGVFLGLGSTYRTLGRYAEAVATLRRGVEEFPDDRALRVFLAMALYNAGDHKEAVESLLRIVVETTGDPQVRRYERAIAIYAADLDRRWD